MGNPTAFTYLTPEEAREKNICPGTSLKQYQKLASNNATCENCTNHVWRLLNNGLCFPCTTGESDASFDYEIGEPYL